MLKAQKILPAQPARNDSGSVHKPWIISPTVDAFTLLSGVTLCLILASLQVIGIDHRMMLIMIASERFVALTHSWSTTYMVTCSKVFKPLRAARRDIFLTTPILIFLFCLLLGVLMAKTSLISDDGALDRSGALYYIYIALYMIGHFWHFGRQDFGVLSAYRHRSRQLSPRDRRVDQHFTQMMMYVIQPIIYLSVFIKFPFFNIVNSVFPLRAIDAVARGAVILAGALFVAVTLFELMKVNRSIPKLVYYTIMLFHPLFLYFGGLGLTPYWYLGYLWSHWLIATTLAARVHMGFQVKQGVSFKRAVITHALAIGWVTLVVWGLTRPLAEFALLNKDFVDAREILRTLPPEKMTIMGLFFGFILGEQLVHYYCDRWLFRFKDADVRAAVAAHLG